MEATEIYRGYLIIIGAPYTGPIARNDICRVPAIENATGVDKGTPKL